MKLLPTTLTLARDPRSVVFASADTTATFKLELRDGKKVFSCVYTPNNAETPEMTDIEAMLTSQFLNLRDSISAWLEAPDGFELVTRSRLIDHFTWMERGKYAAPRATENLLESALLSDQVHVPLELVTGLGMAESFLVEEASPLEIELRNASSLAEVKMRTREALKDVILPPGTAPSLTEAEKAEVAAILAASKARTEEAQRFLRENKDAEA